VREHERECECHVLPVFALEIMLEDSWVVRPVVVVEMFVIVAGGLFFCSVGTAAPTRVYCPDQPTALVQKHVHIPSRWGVTAIIYFTVKSARRTGRLGRGIRRRSDDEGIHTCKLSTSLVLEY